MMQSTIHRTTDNEKRPRPMPLESLVINIDDEPPSENVLHQHRDRHVVEITRLSKMGRFSWVIVIACILPSCLHFFTIISNGASPFYDQTPSAIYSLIILIAAMVFILGGNLISALSTYSAGVGILHGYAFLSGIETTNFEPSKTIAIALLSFCAVTFLFMMADWTDKREKTEDRLASLRAVDAALEPGDLIAFGQMRAKSKEVAGYYESLIKLGRLPIHAEILASAAWINNAPHRLALQESSEIARDLLQRPKKRIAE
jgi:hypothetical protein